MPSWSTYPKQFSLQALCQLLGNINSVITSDYNINSPSWPSSPYQLSNFEPVTLPVRLGIINSHIKSTWSNYNYINRQSWPSSPYQLSSFEPVTLPARLGIINSHITSTWSNHNINRPSWSTSPYQLSTSQLHCHLGWGWSTHTSHQHDQSMI